VEHLVPATKRAGGELGRVGAGGGPINCRELTAGAGRERNVVGFGRAVGAEDGALAGDGIAEIIVGADGALAGDGIAGIVGSTLTLVGMRLLRSSDFLDGAIEIDSRFPMSGTSGADVGG
jgi:hypothetical protein